MEYLHTMIRVEDIDASLKFYSGGLGLKEFRRVDNDKGRFTLVFLASEADIKAANSTHENPLETNIPMVELTYNWPAEDGSFERYTGGRNFGHLAYRVDDIYATCQHLSDLGYDINRPPRDGRMAFVKSPDNISVELLQKGTPLSPQEPWASADNIGSW